MVGAIAVSLFSPADSALAQSRNWTSRFLPQPASTDEPESNDLENREQGRYYRNLVRDENDVRREAGRLRRLVHNARRFTSGSGAAAQQTAFMQLLGEVGARAQVAAVLQEQIPELEAGNFTTRPFCDLIQPDGNLVEPPLMLQQGPARASYTAVQSAWSDIAGNLTADPPTAPHLNPLARAVTRWKSGHRARHQAASGLTAGGLEAHAYLGRTEDLLRALGNGEERARLRMFLLNGGYPFPGGTVGDLVQHLVDNELTVEIGSPAHVVLANLTQEMLLEADAELAVLEDRIEYYKQQSLASQGSSNGGSPFRRGQSVSSPGLPRRDAPGAANAPQQNPPAPVQRVADEPFRRRER